LLDLSCQAANLPPVRHIAELPLQMEVAPLGMLHEDEEADIFHFYQSNFF
jgi:hypothetical protein